ncbi:MAG: hypothetical protein K9L74_04380 [Candidatus Izimaplasma sp.]|nr:hypothetical protein [Candidatus Izimaplasma bacterium]
MIIATAIEALEITTCSYTILEKTAINSPLGVIVIVKITQEGTILLAGPSLKNQLIKLKRKLLDYRPTYIVIDGALFRKSSASTKLADAVILATGASYARSMSSTVLHTTTLSRQLMLPKYPINNLDSSVNYIVDVSHKKTVLNGDLLSNPQGLKKHISNTTKTLFLKGALNDKIAQMLIESRHKFETLDLLIKDATHLLLKDSYYHHLKTIGVNFYVLNPIELVLITVNPTTKKGYFYDEQQFIIALKNKCNIPIINVLKDLE